MRSHIFRRDEPRLGSVMEAARFVCRNIFLCGGKTPFGSTMAHMVACGFGDNEVIVTPPLSPDGRHMHPAGLLTRKEISYVYTLMHCA